MKELDEIALRLEELSVEFNSPELAELHEDLINVDLACDNCEDMRRYKNFVGQMMTEAAKRGLVSEDVLWSAQYGRGVNGTTGVNVAANVQQFYTNHVLSKTQGNLLKGALDV